MSRPRGWNTRRWNAVRAQVLAEEPVCMVCGRKPSVEADHILPVRLDPDGLLWYVRDNVRGLCRQCNRHKGGNLNVQPIDLVPFADW